VIDPDQKILNRVGSGQIFVARVGLGQPFLVLYGFGKFLLKMAIFSIFCLAGQKNVIGSGRKVPGSQPGRPFIYCGSKVCSGRVGSRPISSMQCFNLAAWQVLLS